MAGRFIFLTFIFASIFNYSIALQDCYLRHQFAPNLNDTILTTLGKSIITSKPVAWGQPFFMGCLISKNGNCKLIKKNPGYNDLTCVATSNETFCPHTERVMFEKYFNGENHYCLVTVLKSVTSDKGINEYDFMYQCALYEFHDLSFVSF